MRFEDLPEIRVTEDGRILRDLPQKERLAKFDDNCRSSEKFAFTAELSEELIKATSPREDDGRDR